MNIQIPKEKIETILADLTDAERVVVLTAMKSQSLTNMVTTMANKLSPDSGLDTVLYDMAEELCMKAVMYDAEAAGVNSTEKFRELIARAE